MKEDTEEQEERTTLTALEDRYVWTAMAVTEA